MSDPQLQSYEELPYESNAFTATHPDTLAVVALLHGMEPAPAPRCRVLELGCAGGGNLIPMALTLPESRFVGIDLSPRQVAMGQSRIAEIGLTNIELRPLSIMDVDEGFGAFDYILCHGVFSWVPAPVQEKILSICKERLSPQGVAYVSYNTYPGWHLWSLLRGMMSFHASHFKDTPTKIHQARAFLELLLHAVQGGTDIYARILEDEAAEVRKRGDAYLFHEHLEDVNTPAYFHEFAERAAKHGLQYLEEAHLSQPLPSSIPIEVRDILARMPVGLIHREQYLDFFRGRSFRRTLLCHDALALSRPPAADAITRMYLTAQAKSKKERLDLFSDAAEEFSAPDGRTVSSKDPLVKTALSLLGRHWPSALSFRELWQQAQAAMSGAPEPVRASLDQKPLTLAEALLECYAAHLLDLHAHPPRFASRPGPRPKASTLARLQAPDERLVTNLRHASVELDPFDRAVLHHLDGTRDPQALEAILADLVARDRLDIRVDDLPLKDP
ncbi:MAG: class I SAM-dependent methyltransferase, partial [Gemmataceae bacterium]|nr:class I SAM-dependent methyltransferase [Gemmataceae bacterium]